MRSRRWATRRHRLVGFFGGASAVLLSTRALPPSAFIKGPSGALVAGAGRARTPECLSTIQQQAQVQGAGAPGGSGWEDAPGRGGWERTDAAYNPQWLEIEQRPAEELQWHHAQTAWALAALALWGFEVCRFSQLAPPDGAEVGVAGFFYAGLYTSRYQEVVRLPEHYRVTFYASLGWAFYSFTSLVHVMYPAASGFGPAEALHGAGSAVFLGSCCCFYYFHWARMWRHLNEGRFRPWFALGLAGLTAVHALSAAHIFKVLDDPLWWPTVTQIYPDEWHFVADIRLAELFLTAAALFLVICHLRGVLTGSRNAAAVFVGTVFAPAAALLFEASFLDASAWPHYFMNGPKYF